MKSSMRNSSRRNPSKRRHPRRLRPMSLEVLEGRRLLAGPAIESVDPLSTITSSDGSDEPEYVCMVLDSPPYPPVDISDRIVDRKDLSKSAVLLGDVPTSLWTYGCAPTSAGMMFGYYDRTGYPDMYTGPENGGVCPMVDLGQGIDAVPISGACSIIATQDGFDGRTTAGHVDDYWIETGAPGPDPWEATGVEHEWGDCTADFMGTNQWKWDTHPAVCPDGVIDANPDGSTRWFYKPSGHPWHDRVPPESDGTPPPRRVTG